MRPRTAVRIVDPVVLEGSTMPKRTRVVPKLKPLPVMSVGRSRLRPWIRFAMPHTFHTRSSTTICSITLQRALSRAEDVVERWQP